MPVSSIMSSQMSASFQMYSASAANGGATAGDMLTGATGGGFSPTDSFEFSAESMSMSVAVGSADALMGGSESGQTTDEMLKLVIAMLVLAYLLGDEQTQQGAMESLSNLLDQSSEQITMTISSTSMSMSMQGGGGSAEPAPMPAPTGGSLDVMA